MKKTIEVNLNLVDPFFVELKEKVMDMNGVDGFEEYMPTIISPVMNATLKTLSNLSSKQKKLTHLTKISYEKEEDVYSDFRTLLESNIDTALNRRIHTSTLERISDIIENYIIEYSDKQKEENRIKVEPLVDADKELTAITNYISTTWNGFTDESSPEFFKKVWFSLNNTLKNHFDHMSLFDFREQLHELKDIPNIQINGVSSKELPLYFILSISALKDSLKNEWNYEKNVNSIIAEMKAEFPYISKAKPKNWNEMAKNYSDYDGMRELDQKSLRKLFGGINSETASSASFEIRTALPHVIYNDKAQSIKPLQTLVGAIAGHAYVLNEINNGSKMLQEWIDLKDQVDNNPAQDITFEFKQPLNQAFLEVIKNLGEVTPSALELLDISNKKKKPKI